MRQVGRPLPANAGLASALLLPASRGLDGAREGGGPASASVRAQAELQARRRGAVRFARVEPNRSRYGYLAHRSGGVCTAIAGERMRIGVSFWEAARERTLDPKSPHDALFREHNREAGEVGAQARWHQRSHPASSPLTTACHEDDDRPQAPGGSGEHTLLSKPQISALRPGHWRCLEQLERPHAYTETRRLYAEGVGQHGVYLRPTDSGFTVLSLDHERCRSMVGVGARDTNQHCVRHLPPAPDKVSAAVHGYREKMANLARGSAEECYALELMSRALNGDLALPWPNTFFVHQEWRLPSGDKVDLLAVDPEARSLVVIELKDSQLAAERRDAAKGGTALEQARAYAAELHRFRAELYPYFERLARALALHHGAYAAFARFALDPEHVAMARVSWPGERATTDAACQQP